MFFFFSFLTIFIGLKLTLQTKRRANGSGDEGRKKTRKEDGSGADDEEDDEGSSTSGRGGGVSNNFSSSVINDFKVVTDLDTMIE